MMNRGNNHTIIYIYTRISKAELDIALICYCLNVRLLG